MRPLCLAYGVLAIPLVGCSSSQTGTTTDDAGGSDAIADSASSPDADIVPDMQACTSDASRCLFGSAEVFMGDAAAAQFAVAPTGLKAILFRQFPSTGISPTDQQLVAKDHTWAFSALDAWAHYYVEFVPGFPVAAGVTKTVATVVGPLTVPGTGTSVDVNVKPVQLNVFEASSGAAQNQLEGATARLDEVTGGSANVSLLVGTGEQTMPYDPSAQAYTVTFTKAPLPTAQPTYRITSLASAATADWQLVADPPAFTGTITQPPPGAVLPAAGAICVTWSREPADYVAVELFKRDSSGSWISIYNSPPQPADLPATSSCDGGGASTGATALTIPGTLDDGGVRTPAGSYLLNVSFTKANCPVTADGCVHSSTVANELFTVK